MKVVAIINDVVGVLLTGSYEDPDTLVAVGIGMLMNKGEAVLSSSGTCHPVTTVSNV